MNLTDMAAQVCADTGYLDTDDVAYAKTTLRQRDDMLWRMGLWKDSLAQLNLTVDPVNNADHAAGIIYVPELIERVVAVRTLDQWLRVSGLETFYRVDFDKFGATGSPYEFAKLAPAWFRVNLHTYGSDYLAFRPDSTADNNVQLQVTWYDQENVRYVQTLTALGIMQPPSTASDSIVTIESVFKPTTNGAIGIYPEGLDTALATLAAADTKSPTKQRIRIFPIPTVAGGLKLLGKVAYVPLTFDQQEPRITGSHLELMAFAKHQLLKRGGENGAAADLLLEGQALLDTLKKEELLQEANNQRIMPDTGYGDIYFGPGRDGFWVG